MFEKITNSFNSVISSIKKKKIITEADFDATIRDIRVALLEADVSLSIVKEFIKNLKEKAIGQQVIKSVKPGEMLIKLVNDELIELLGDDLGDVSLYSQPTIIMVTGLQGSGKTTSAAKLADRIKTKFNKKVLLVSLDIYRPAAQTQLAILARQAGIDCLEIIPGQAPLDICKRALLLQKEYDAIIFDTAGRLHIDNELMKELQEIKDCIQPDETFLVVDSLMGQDSVLVAKEFNAQIKIDSIILTRLDGDGRGGCALSMRLVSGCPIRYIGTGEKLKEFSLFHPERLASRILDMGDIVSFVEKAEEVVEKEEIEKLEEKLRKGTFDLNDLLRQLKTIKKMGGIFNILSFLPGASKLKDFMNNNLDDQNFKRQEAIICAMTNQERIYPDILNSSRKFRIARGSGTSVQEVNTLLKRFKTMKDVVDKLGKMNSTQLKEIMRDFGDINNVF